ncbi:MAG: cytochrome b/b6 domain-containing protein [Burkholderiales bacterium]|nr:cytochrome b/b6 domain-containing protein [Burkholderiales bacterium]
MNTASASPADAPPTAAGRQRILVWDAPSRLFHGLIVLSFAGAYLSAESERWRLLHVTLGYTMAGLVAFRLVWGLLGTRHARFAAFVRGPRAVVRYLQAALRGRAEHHVGHNPAGALAIVALLLLAAAVSATGWALYDGPPAARFEDWHEGAANAMLALVGLHVCGVVFASRLHRENLAAAMISGRKTGRPQDGIGSARRGVAALLLAAVLGYWWLQWQTVASSGGAADRPPAAARPTPAADADD